MKLDSEILIRQLSEGNPAAFTEIYNKFYPSIYYYTKSFVLSEEDARDLVSDVFIKLWDIRQDITGIICLEAYLKRIAKNTCINYLKRADIKARVHKEIAFQQEKTEAEDIFRKIETRYEVINFVARKIEQLPDKYQKVYKLSFIDGLKNDEIAEKMNLSNQIVRNIKTHVLKIIRMSIQESDLIGLVILFCLSK